MKKIKKEDISQEVFDLYDDYAHNKLDTQTICRKTFSLCCWWIDSSYLC